MIEHASSVYKDIAAVNSSLRGGHSPGTILRLPVTPIHGCVELDVRDDVMLLGSPHKVILQTDG